jgi:hypothetical protein
MVPGDVTLGKKGGKKIWYQEFPAGPGSLREDWGSGWVDKHPLI